MKLFIGITLLVCRIYMYDAAKSDVHKSDVRSELKGLLQFLQKERQGRSFTDHLSTIQGGLTAITALLGKAKDQNEEANETDDKRDITKKWFLCDNFEYVSDSYVCDRVDDCGDFSDEMYCCPTGQFSCLNTVCIRASYECDGYDDCGDNSDEENCPGAVPTPAPAPVCSSGWFACNDGACKLNDWKCDGMDDCSNGEDELNCGAAPNPAPTPAPVAPGGSGGSGNIGGGGDTMCGLAPKWRTANSQFVVGGTEAQKNRYPWQVLLSICFGQYGQYGCFQCGGSILNKDWILTAAHCVHNAQAGWASASGVKVTVGAHKKDLGSYETEEGRKEVIVSNVIYHNGYGQGSEVANDIALLKLQTPLTWSDQVRPVCLPEADISAEGSGSIPCVISGWGLTSSGQDASTAPVLQMANVPVWPDQQCLTFWSTSQYLDTNVCAGVQGSIATCQGDSGGPLVCENTSATGNPFVLMGVTSYGPKVCKDGPSVYTNVYQYRQWINEKTGGAIPVSGNPSY